MPQNHWLNRIKPLVGFCCHRNGFEEEQIEALLHKIEIQMKHQSTNFGLSLASVSLSDLSMPSARHSFFPAYLFSESVMSRVSLF